jgi:alpha-1,3-fucosyltransferase
MSIIQAQLIWIIAKRFVFKVDVFGRCGTPCPHVGCKKQIVEKYMFYLAFENAFCPDYISEKFWRMISEPIVLVVRGGGVYDRYVRS